MGRRFRKLGDLGNLGDVGILIERFSFCLLILLLPIQLGKHWWPEWSLVNGIRVDYLAPTLYVTDLLLMALAVVWGLKNFREFREFREIRINWRKLGVLGIWGIWGMWVILRAERSMLALYWLTRYLEIGVMAIATHRVIQGIRGVRGVEIIQKTLAIGVIFLVGLEILQIFWGRTTGWFWWLGERSFAINTPGIATIAIWGREILRPYATFSHPNALGGYLAVAGILVGLRGIGGNRGDKGDKGAEITKKIAFLGVVLTGSRVAIAATALGYLGIWGDLGGFRGAEKASSLILFAPRAVEERAILNQAGWEMFRNNWLWGVGPGQFLVQLPEYLPAYERSLQPVHNVFLLLLDEFGMIGGVLLLIGIRSVWGFRGLRGFRGILAIMGITAIVDHYWVTSQQNRLLLGLVIGLIERNKLLK